VRGFCRGIEKEEKEKKEKNISLNLISLR